MANYNLVVNSKFQPFSFERYIQPYQIYGQAYREVEDALTELSTKANVWEEMANEQTDPYAYQMYKTYANDLESQAGQLAREGLNATSRKSMLNMRSRYSKEITPIELAYSTRQKQAEEQQKALLQDPTLMLSRRAATTSLDDYIRNPQLAYESYSGKLLTAQVSQAASALAKQMQEQPRKWRRILDDQYYEAIMRKGFSSDAVLQAIQGNPQASQELTRIVDDTLASSGVLDWGDTDIIKRAVGYARDGLWSAVGETQYQTLQNRDWKPTEVPQLPGYTPVSLLGNPFNIDAANLLYKDRKKLEEFSEFFDENGKLTEAGKKAYLDKVVSHKSAREGEYRESSPFFNYIADISGTRVNEYLQDRKELTVEEIENIYSKYKADLTMAGGVNADVIRNTGFNVKFEDPNIILDALTGGINNGVVPVREYTKDGYKDIGTINLNDKKFKNATIAGEYGLQGNYIVITTKNNEQYRVPLSTINIALDGAVTSSLVAAYKSMFKPDGTPYTKEELDKVVYNPITKSLISKRDVINTQLNNALYNFGAVAEEVKTKPLEVTGGLH